jgi:hypothetical protein
VDYSDLAVLVQYWLDTDCATKSDCDGADLEPQSSPDGDVDWADHAVFAQFWGETGCPQP